MEGFAVAVDGGDGDGSQRACRGIVVIRTSRVMGYF